MGSLCGQVNMTWRMNRSAVTLFLQLPHLMHTEPNWKPLKKNTPKKKQDKPKINQQRIFSLNMVRNQ